MMPRGSAQPTSSDFVPISLPQQIADQVYDLLAVGALSPGDHINELRLSQRFGVSRAPIREAARILERKGLVELSPRRGFFVRTLTRKAVEEIFEIRTWSELLALDRLFASPSPHRLDAVTTTLSSLRAANAASDPHLVVEGDMQLHRSIMQSIGNDRLIKIHEDITSELRLALSYTSRSLPDVGSMLEFHREIFDAIVDGDQKSARAELKRHLDRSCRRICEKLSG